MIKLIIATMTLSALVATASDLLIKTLKGNSYQIRMDRTNKWIDVDWNQEIVGNIRVIDWKDFDKQNCDFNYNSASTSLLEGVFRDRIAVRIAVDLNDFKPTSQEFEELSKNRIGLFINDVNSYDYIPRSTSKIFIRSHLNPKPNSLSQKLGTTSAVETLDLRLNDILRDGYVEFDISEKDFACDILNNKIEVSLSLSVENARLEFVPVLSQQDIRNISYEMNRKWQKIEDSSLEALREKNLMQATILLSEILILKNLALSHLGYDNFYLLIKELHASIDYSPARLSTQDAARVSKLLGVSRSNSRLVTKNIELKK